MTEFTTTIAVEGGHESQNNKLSLEKYNVRVNGQDLVSPVLDAMGSDIGFAVVLDTAGNNAATIYGQGIDNQPYINFIGARGTVAAPTVSQVADGVGGIDFSAWIGDVPSPQFCGQIACSLQEITGANNDTPGSSVFMSYVDANGEHFMISGTSDLGLFFTNGFILSKDDIFPNAKPAGVDTEVQQYGDSHVIQFSRSNGTNLAPTAITSGSVAIDLIGAGRATDGTMAPMIAITGSCGGSVGTSTVPGELFIQTSNLTDGLKTAMHIDRSQNTDFRANVTVNNSAIVAPDNQPILRVSSIYQSAIPAPLQTTAQRDALPTPTSGDQVYDNTVDRPSWHNGTGWNNVATDPVIGHIYMNNNATATTIVTQSVAVKVAGITTANLVDTDLTAADNRLTYTGLETRTYQLVFSLCGSSTGLNITHSAFVYKNGVVFAPIKACTDWNMAGRLEGMTGSGLVSLATNDYVEVWIANEDGTQNPTVQELSLMLVSV